MMTKTPHDSLLLNIYKNVQLKTEWGGYVQMQLRGTERLAPPGGPHTRWSSRRRRFSFGSQITFNGLRSCTLRPALPPQSHNNFPFAPIRTLGRLCLSASNIAKGIFSCISRPINNSTKQEGLKLKSWWRSDARQCLCESVSHLLRQCTRASVGIVSAVERIGNNAIRSRLGGIHGRDGATLCYTFHGNRESSRGKNVKCFAHVQLGSSVASSHIYQKFIIFIPQIRFSHFSHLYIIVTILRQWHSFNTNTENR